jgi:hypothetical protein
MAKHILALNFPDTSNEGIFRIDDESIYDPSLGVSCLNLQILPPGAMYPSVIEGFNSGFRLVLNACTIGIMGPSSCADSCPGLQDGIYNIRYSVSPNDRVWVEYKHMRIVHALNRWNDLLCRVKLTACLPDQGTEQQLRELDIIHNYLISSKVTCEDEHVFDDAINQYRYALTLMDKLAYKKPFCHV